MFILSDDELFFFEVNKLMTIVNTLRSLFCFVLRFKLLLFDDSKLFFVILRFSTILLHFICLSTFCLMILVPTREMIFRKTFCRGKFSQKISGFDLFIYILSYVLGSYAGNFLRNTFCRREIFLENIRLYNTYLIVVLRRVLSAGSYLSIIFMNHA